jgi:anthranilate synthase
MRYPIAPRCLQQLGVLEYPVHGKRSTVRHNDQGIFEGMPKELQVGRYHSLFARRETFPACLEVTAETIEGGVIMGVRHKELPIEAVQFHPESILTMAPGSNCGLQLIQNAVRLAKPAQARVG